MQRWEVIIKKIRILIADDHPLFLEGLSTVLPLKDPEIIIVAAVSNGEEAVKKDKETKPDVVLLDIKMPVMDGIEAAKLILKQHPGAKIVMLTTFNDRELVYAALQAGAKGYILKSTPVEDVIQDIKTVYRGKVLMSVEAAEKLSWSSYQENIHEKREKDIPKQAYDFIYGLDKFNNREKQILLLMMKDMDNQQIADKIFLSEKTVRNYISHIYEILDIHNRTEVLRWVLDQVAPE